MIYQFPTNRTINSALEGDSGSTLESYLDSNLPKGKLGKLVDLAIEIKTGTGISPFINTKVPIGKRDKLIEICFIKDYYFFTCSIESSTREQSQLIDFSELVNFVEVARPKHLKLVPMYIVLDQNRKNLVMDGAKLFKNTELFTVERALLCDTLISWPS